MLTDHPCTEWLGLRECGRLPTTTVLLVHELRPRWLCEQHAKGWD